MPCPANGQSRARTWEKALRVVEGKELRCACRDSWVVAMEMAVEYSRSGGTENVMMVGVLSMAFRWQSNLWRLLQATNGGGLLVSLGKPLERAISGGRKNGPLNNVEIPSCACWSPSLCWSSAALRTQGILTCDLLEICQMEVLQCKSSGNDTSRNAALFKLDFCQPCTQTVKLSKPRRRQRFEFRRDPPVPPGLRSNCRWLDPVISINSTPTMAAAVAAEFALDDQ